MPPRKLHASGRWAVRACCAGCAAFLLGMPIGIGAEPDLVLSRAHASSEAVQVRDAPGAGHNHSMVMLMLFGSGAGSQSLFGRLGQ